MLKKKFKFFGVMEDKEDREGTARQRTKLLSWTPPIGGVYGLLQAFFISRETPTAERR